MALPFDSVSDAVPSEDFFAASNVLLVAGKGGVGKTTVGACLALAATKLGYDVLLVELEGYSSLASLFDTDDLGYEPVEVEVANGRLRLAQFRPDDVLERYLDDAGLGLLVRRLSRTGAVDVVAAATPGIRDLVTLGKVRQLEQTKAADLIIVDAPASGHARSLLTTPRAMADSAESGRIRDQADQILDMFADPTRCQVLLVTLAEETPVTETIETAFELEERVDIKLGPVIVNSVWPPLPGLARSLARASSDLDDKARSAAEFRQARVADQQGEIERLAAELPLDQIHLPYLFTADLDRHDLEALADELIDLTTAGAGKPGPGDR